MTKLLGICFLAVSSLTAQTKAPGSPDNAELTKLYAEDQRVRQPKPLTPDERASITRTDADRLTLVKEMVAKEELTTATDYRHAAFIAQHSLISSDYLLAHTLAMICASQGDKTCLWLSAATLDRYLQSVNQAQIYGTQFIGSSGSPPTQQPYESGLIPDSLRQALGVPTLAQQKVQLDGLTNHNVLVPIPGTPRARDPDSPK